jgi:phospholipase C
MFPDPQPIIPYGQQNPSTALATEAGHRATRGILTEGRYLVIQEPGSSNRGLGVSSTRGRSTLSSFSVPTKKETEPSIRFIIYELGTFPDMQYQIQSAFLKNSAKDSSSYLGSDLEFTTKSEAATFAITYTSDGTSYSIQVTSSKKYISISSGGQVTLSSAPYQFSVFAITF